jgi:hypothetical protein
VTQRRRETRHYFLAIAEIVDVSSQAEFVSVTRNLSLSGCLVKTTTAFPKETKVRVRITSPGIEFGAIDKVGAHGRGAAPEGVALRRLPGRGEQGCSFGRPAENARWASLLEGLLEARDFVLQAGDAARDGKVINEEDGPDGEIGGHQAIEIFHLASDSFRPKKRRDVHGFFRLDNTS